MSTAAMRRGGGTVISLVTHNPAGLASVTVSMLTEPGERSTVQHVPIGSQYPSNRGHFA
jgi:hypothetical protein